MEEKIINMNQFLGAAQGDQEHMLGKFLYFSLANLLVDKDELSSLCESMGIPYTGSTRLSLGDAFRSATGDIRERVPVTVDGETNIYLAYQEKCDYLIKSSSQSPAVMERWVLKVQALEEKKRHYEGVLQRELDGLDDEFSVLKLLSQELQVRARSIRSQRFQQRAA